MMVKKMPGVAGKKIYWGGVSAGLKIYARGLLDTVINNCQILSQTPGDSDTELILS